MLQFGDALMMSIKYFIPTPFQGGYLSFESISLTLLTISLPSVACAHPFL